MTDTRTLAEVVDIERGRSQEQALSVIGDWGVSDRVALGDGSECSCGAEAIWVTHETGRRLIDALPDTALAGSLRRYFRTPA